MEILEQLKTAFKSHYDLKEGWLLAFMFLPQAILFNILAVKERAKRKQNHFYQLYFLAPCWKNLSTECAELNF